MYTWQCRLPRTIVRSCHSWSKSTDKDSALACNIHKLSKLQKHYINLKKPGLLNIQRLIYLIIIYWTILRIFHMYRYAHNSWSEPRNLMITALDANRQSGKVFGFDYNSPSSWRKTKQMHLLTKFNHGPISSNCRGTYNSFTDVRFLFFHEPI